MRARARSRRPVLETDLTFCEPTPPPLIRGLARHAHFSRDMRHRSPGGDPLDHDPAPARRHRRVTVHQSLLRVRGSSTTTRSLGGSVHWRTHTHVTNVD